MPREDLIQIRRGTASGWTSVNPTLANGEFGFETDTGKLKCGDGSSAWVELGYVSSDVSLQTNPVENEYADITALLADQGNQTETFFQYVIDASADPNIASGDAYYEKLSGSTGTLATDYRLLSDTETQIITDSNGYRVFRIQYIQDDSSPNNTATGGRIGFNYDTGTDKVTSVVFNNIYSNALDIFYAQRASNTYKLKFYNRNTGVYSFATVTGWTVNGNYYIVDVDSGIDISEISVNNRIELFFEIDNGASALEYGTAITGSSTTLTTSNLNTVNRFESASAQTATLNDGVFSLNDEIYFTRTGAGSFELVKGTNVRLTGVRDVENRFFINDKNSWICAKYMEDDGSTEVWQVFGNITRGYTGAVTTLSYSDLFATASAQNVTVNGTGFSDNMEVTITGNATLNSFTVNSSTQVILNITPSGSVSDLLTITYDNGDVFVDTDAIELVASSLIAYYKLDEASGTTVTDTKGSFNGTSANITFGTAGKVGDCYDFDGSTSTCSLLNSDEFMATATTPFTIMGWFNADSLGATRWAMFMPRSSTAAVFYIIYNSSNIEFVRPGIGTSNIAASSTGTWGHIAVVWSGTAVNVYYNGSDTGISGTLNGYTGAAFPVLVGNQTTRYFDGKVDEIGIYNEALDASTVAAKYALGNAGNPLE